MLAMSITRIKESQKKTHTKMSKTNSKLEKRESNVSEDSRHKDIPDKQRALVLQGGGALGAYEVGVLKVLCKNLSKMKGRDGKDEPLFDIIAGTSIGAMNGAILLRQFLETQSWEKAVEKLESFWTKQLSLKCLDTIDLSKSWYDEWIKRTPTAASEEAARRYYAVKKILKEGRNKMYNLELIIDDDRFFDRMYADKGPNDDNADCKDPNCKKPNFLNNIWFRHSNNPLEESIKKYARFPILTDRKNNQPRLLVFSVDVAEGVTVTFDSYPKADGSRKSEYGKYLEEKGKYENIINYNDGISIKHVMASGTLPEFYNYAEIPIDPTVKQKDHEEIRYFWDGGLLSNTPLRELLDAHQEYWRDVENKEDVENKDDIPELEIYIVNVHPSKVDCDKIPKDHDGVKDRQNDITYGDRSSRYDENMTHLITDYTNFATEMKELAKAAISKVNDKELKEKFQNILDTKTISKDRKGASRKYENLTKRFKLKVIRIERTNYTNSIHGKTGDLTLQTINKLIKEGDIDAWFSLIQNDINDMELLKNIKDSLIVKMNEAMENLRSNDYEDNDSQAYHTLTEFIEAAKNKHKLKPDDSVRLIKSVEALMARLD